MKVRHQMALIRARVMAMLALEESSLGDLAARMGISQSNLSRMLHANPPRRGGGHRWAGLAEPVERIAEALDMPVESLEHGDPCPICGRGPAAEDKTSTQAEAA